MSKSKADIIMENAVRHGLFSGVSETLVTHRNIKMEPVEPGDVTGLPAREPAPHPDPFLTMLDDAIKRRAYGEFIPLPLFKAVMEMVNTLPNTKLNHEHYPDTYSVAAALEKLRRLNPLPIEEKMEYQSE